MYENEENLLLLKDLFPDSWSKNPEFSKYINELCSFGISRLYNEPQNLADERSKILAETQKLAFNNYKTFIQTADCSKDVFRDFQIVEQHLDNILTELPTLQTAYNKFIAEGSQINANRKLNTTTLLKHAHLLEILELPQLMDTCVRNSYYDEALELAEYTRRLVKRHSNIPIICNLIEEIKTSLNLMLTQLVGQLRSDLQLPTFLRVVGYLRRMNVFTEVELRVKFLQVRSEWFHNILKAISTDDAYHHISKVIELSRVHLFDIVTQYRAIFSEDEFNFLKDNECEEGTLFYSWIVEKISEFLVTLETDISTGVGNRLDALLGQCMYFGLSFGRVGLDFRSLMVPIFQRAIVNIIVTSIDAAEAKLDEALKVYSLLGGGFSAPTFILPAQPANNLQAPILLLEFPPLAIYCNDLLSLFNDLRLCMPLSLATDVARLLQKSLTNVSAFLLTFHRVDESTFNTKELELFTRLCGTFANELIPFLNNCLVHLFPTDQLTLVSGLFTTETTKAMLGRLDSEVIISSIKHLVPARVFTSSFNNSSITTATIDLNTINTDPNISLSNTIDPKLSSVDIIDHQLSTENTDYPKLSSDNTNAPQITLLDTNDTNLNDRNDLNQNIMLLDKQITLDSNDIPIARKSDPVLLDDIGNIDTNQNSLNSSFISDTANSNVISASLKPNPDFKNEPNAYTDITNTDVMATNLSNVIDSIQLTEMIPKQETMKDFIVSEAKDPKIESFEDKIESNGINTDYKVKSNIE